MSSALLGRTAAGKLVDLLLNTDGSLNSTVDQTTEGTTNRVVAGKATVITVTPVLDTSAYTANDCLFPEAAIANAVRAAGLGTTLCGVSLIDKDDEGAQVTLYFFDADPDFGSANNAPSISDANAAKYLGKVDIATTDYVDLGGAKVAHIRGFALPMIPASGTSLYVAATTTGTPTYTSASDIVLRLHFLQD